MGIRYLCSDCSKKLSLTGFGTINEAHRKYCDRCGGNDDDLIVVGEAEFDLATLDSTRDQGFSKYYLDRELCLSGI